MLKRNLTVILFAAVALSLVAQEPAAQASHEVFMAKFEEAVKADNYAAMKELVVRNQPELLNGYFLYEYQFASAIANKNDEDKAARIAVLEKFVTFVTQEFKDKWYVERLAWAKTFTPEQAAKRIEVETNVLEGASAFRRGEKSGDKKDWTDARAKFEKVIPVAQEIGDVYWQIDADVWLAGVAEKLEEKFEAAYHFKRAMEVAREAKQSNTIAKYDLPGKLKRAARDGLRDDLIDIKIAVAMAKVKYAATIEKLTAEAAAGGAESRGAGAGAGGGAGGPKGAMPSTLPPMANKHTMRIEWVDAEKPKYAEVVGRPMLTSNVRANAHWSNWYAIEVAASAKSTILPGEHFLQNEKGKLLFDPDGAGKAGDERIKVAVGKPEVVVFKNRGFPDGGKVDVRHLMLEMPRTFTINGVGMQFKGPGPGDPMPIYLQGATSVTAKFDGYDITIYDDSANGDFSNYGDDSVAVTKGKVSRVTPLSRYIYVGDLLFELKVDPNGQNLRLKPYDGPVALLEFKYVANTMPAFMNLEGLNENAQAFFNLMDCKDKPMWVPPGEYKFRDGYFSYGKDETITVSAGTATSFKVAEGQLTKYEMGGAKTPGFTYQWKAELEKEKDKTLIRLKGKDLRIHGAAGEEYSRFYVGATRPHVRVRTGKDGPVFFDKQMKAPAAEDLNVVPKRHWSIIVYYPKDIEAEKTSSGDAFVQLEGDHPKLGKITSTPQQVP